MGIFSKNGLMINRVLLFIQYIVFADTQLTLVVPSSPVATSTHQDVLLPCHLSPERSAADAKEIRWFKESFNNLVYLHKSGKVTEGRGYEGRVSLFPQELQRGNVSLLLRNVRLTDGGKYKCQVSFSDWFEEPALQLTVRQPGSRPLVEILRHNRDCIQMSCSSKDWYPEPYMFWMNIRGKKMEAIIEKSKQSGGSGVFSISSQISFCKLDTAGVRCVVGQQDQELQFESLVKVTDEFFMSTLPDRLHVSAIVIPITLGLVCALIAVLLFINQRKVCREKLKDFDDVTLDPDTAHPKLRVHEDGKSVSAVNKSLPVEPNKKRFDDHLCVLAKEGFSSGKHYWQVEVQDKTSWVIGVGKEDKDTKEVFTPEEGYWTLYYSKNDEFCAVTVPETPLPADLKPQTVGVFMHYERGQLSFYNVDERCHIYTFNGTFQEKLFPFFGTRVTSDVTLDKDTAHRKLKISDDGKEVQWIEEGVQNESNGFNRFDTEPFVLGTVVRSWRSYWEVRVEEKEDWVLGVALASANRKGQLTMGPSEGFWVIRLSNGRSLKALSEKVEVLTDISPPSTVGIYLDCKEKQVSFYSVHGERGSHIYTFKDGPGYDSNVCPIVSPWNNDDNKIRILSITP
ncbi:butyrophilin subfamily 3 member A3-like [Scleropages formosus]|uniref:butyrophilin subfamily 3 member A3-like n=1 Tax=Scleropages formosus TaxID=113540 RepID=UPI0010FA8B50|nr:butyrophilin subfamily 3 member A3-like [Scleropages formosus]